VRNLDIAERITLTRAIIFEIQTGAGQPGGPISVDGYSLEDVNACVEVMVSEGLLRAQPPGVVYADHWVAGSVTYAGLEFVEAYRTDQNIDAVLRRTARSRSVEDTFLEVISVLVKALQIGGP
jgi:hypothetical protein